MSAGIRYIVLVALVVAFGGFLIGYDASVIYGTVPPIKKYFDLTITGGDVRLGWSAFLSYRLPILVMLPFLMCVLRNQQQPVVVLECRLGAQKRLPLAGTKE